MNAAQKQLWLDVESMIKMLSVIRDRLVEKKELAEAKIWCKLAVGVLEAILKERDASFLSEAFVSLCENSLQEFKI